MLTVLVTNTKGGCGKTTISTCLAGAFAQAGFTTVLADCDRQRSSLEWSKRRPDRFPAIEIANWIKEDGATPKGTQRLVIDVPAGIRRKRLDALVKAADMIILPILPSVFDENSTKRFLKVLDDLKPVRKGKRAVGVVANRMRFRTKAAANLEAFMERIGHPVVARLRDSQMYPSAAEDGLSLFDMPAGRTRSVVQDWLPLLSFIDDETFKVR